MTVKELIEHLQTLPQDYLVAYERYSDFDKMTTDHIRVIKAEDRKIIQHHNMDDIMRIYADYENPAFGHPAPVFLNVVLFPGN